MTQVQAQRKITRALNGMLASAESRVHKFTGFAEKENASPPSHTASWRSRHKIKTNEIS
jgi:hypothetical protein